MTTTYKSKAELKAEQNASQEVKSQDDVQNLSITDGVTKFYETRCEFYENVFMQADQQAAKDVMGKFLTYDKGNREAVGGAFFGNLSTKRQALSFGLLPSLFLPEAAESVIELTEEEKALCERNDQLQEKEASGNITAEEADELAQIQKQLDGLGLLK